MAGRIRTYTAALVLLLVLWPVLLATGCGPETSRANELVQEAVDLETSVEADWQKVNTSLAAALDQQAAGQIQAEIASLTEAQTSIARVTEGLVQAKSKIDEATELNISDVHRQFLEAMSRGIAGGIELMEASSSMTAALLADPQLSQPGTRQLVEQFQRDVMRIDQEVQSAEEEASRIAEENPDEIQQK